MAKDKQKIDWSNVIDELCECGQRKSEHEPLPKLLELGETKDTSGGLPRTKCKRFTWVSFIEGKKK